MKDIVVERLWTVFFLVASVMASVAFFFMIVKGVRVVPFGVYMYLLLVLWVVVLKYARLVWLGDEEVSSDG